MSVAFWSKSCAPPDRADVHAGEGADVGAAAGMRCSVGLAENRAPTFYLPWRSVSSVYSSSQSGGFGLSLLVSQPPGGTASADDSL